MGSQLSYKFRLQPLTAVNIFPDCFRRWSASCKMPWRRRRRPPDGQCVFAVRTDLLQDPLRDDKDEDSRLPGSLNQGTLKSSKISECLLQSNIIYIYTYILHCSINDGAHGESTCIQTRSSVPWESMTTFALCDILWQWRGAEGEYRWVLHVGAAVCCSGVGSFYCWIHHSMSYHTGSHGPGFSSGLPGCSAARVCDDSESRRRTKIVDSLHW